MIVIHETVEIADQLQVTGAETETVDEFAVAKTLRDVGVIEVTQEVPACVTVKVCPATVSVPTRREVVELLATE